MRNHIRRTAAIVLAAAALGACSSVSGLLDSSGGTSTSRSTDPGVPSASGSTPSGLLSGIGTDSSTTSPPGEGNFKADDLPCPDVTVRPGAGTLTLGSKSQIGEVNAMDLRYQGTLVQFARECSLRGTNMAMKVGIEGRVITGPAGGPGQVEVPLRLAVVQEGPNPRTVLSKLARISVTVTGEQPTTDFTHIDSEVVFPLPRPIDPLANYVVYVGFDPSALAPQRPAPRASRKR